MSYVVVVWSSVCVLFPLLGIFDSVFADSRTTEKAQRNKRASTAGVEIQKGPAWKRSKDMTGWRRKRRERERKELIR